MSLEPAEGRLDFADRWLRDGLQVLHPSVSVLQVTVDMTHALERLAILRRAGTAASATHLVVHAVGRTLADNPALHQLIAGNRRVRPTHVDVGLSVAGESFVAPVLVLEGADKKSIEALVEETTRRAPEVRKNDAQMLALLRRIGWLVPLAVLRRALLRLLFRSPGFRRKGAGTFLVSPVAVDWACTAVFATTGVLFPGAVLQKVVAIDGQPVVRPMMTLTLSVDHGVWDGRAATRFISSVKAALERAAD